MFKSLMIAGMMAGLSVFASGSLAAFEEKSTEDTEMPKFTEAGHTTDSLEKVQSRIEAKEAILLDVREQMEWDAGHLSKARLMPLSKIKDGMIPEEFLKMLPKDKTIYLHCRSGGRVLKCAEALKDKGYDIRPLKSGYEALVKFGFEKAEEK
ncbi:MAG: rhodanese-like domain-containing protein [Planctomyces sp.]|nr:rhodanese-like domain-containing protein [Planctomyces sp.]